MRILWRRFLASYLASLAACVGGCLLALAIVDMLVDFDRIVEGGPAALGALLARVPGRWLGEALPLASFAAAFLATAIPARRGEVLGLCAAGIHPARVTLPILGAALLVGAASSALPVREPLPGAERIARVGAGWIRDGDRLVRVGQHDSRSGELRDVHWFETDPAFRLRRSLHAAQARVAGDRWELRSARELRFDPQAPAAAPRAAAAPAWVAAPQASPAPRPASDPTTARRAAPSAALAAAALLVLALLALPIGLCVRASGSLAGPALAALSLAALFRGAGQAAEFAAERGALPSAPAEGLVLAAFATAAAACWARTPR